MEIILLEKVHNLGGIGDKVAVKPGYARNFLLPQKKALPATSENIAYFEAQKAEIEKQNEARKKDAEKLVSKFDNLTVTLVRKAPDSGKLYGSVTSRDIADIVSKAAAPIDRNQVILNDALKTLGLFKLDIALHPEVMVQVTINIARSQEEAAIQLERGEALVSTSSQKAPENTPAEEPVETEATETSEDATEATDADSETTDQSSDDEAASA